MDEQLKEISELTNYLNQRTEEYDKGTPTISDKEWDNLYFKLKALEDKTGIIMCDSPTQVVHYATVDALQKVTHNHKMLSLAKTKDWTEFLAYFGNKDVIGMVKLDGLTCSLEYIDGKLVSAETRGNGIIGEDVLHNAQVISSIPKKIPYYDHLIVDGEIICTDSDFIEFSNDYANSRNFASGSIRLLDSRECEKRKLTFIVWNVVVGFEDKDRFISKLVEVEKLGFKVVPWTSSFDWDAKEFLINQAHKLGYPIDGLVGRFDDITYGLSLGETDHHSKAAFAFKFYDETYPSTLQSIEWTMGRTGILTPVAIFDAIEIEGSTVERASLHNYSVMRQIMNHPFIGQKIQIFKANMIIPQIYEAEQVDSSEKRDWILPPTVCPICGQPVTVKESDSGVENIICLNPDCEGKLINKLDHFCGKKGLDIKGLSKATLEKLIDWGWVTNLSDIFTLSQYRAEWVKKTGFGDKSVDNILNAVEGAKSPSLDKFISSLGIPLIGKTVSKELVKQIKTYEEFREKAISHFDFSSYEGFADSKTSAIWNYDFAEADKIYSYLTIPVAEDSQNSSSLQGITVVITGKLMNYKNRAELQSAIEAAGGKVVGSVSKNTNYLINNDSTSTSAKNLSAQKLGVPILTEQEFIEKFF